MDAKQSISALARQFGLSRSTLLHYDRIGLLSAERRSEAGYRQYGEQARKRLARIIELRAAGLPLAEVKAALASDTPLERLLENQITELNRKMENLRAQQANALALLRLSRNTSVPLDKERWSQMFREAGMTDADMRRWHGRFEAALPDAHRDFLAFLGLDAKEIEHIRKWSRELEKR